MTRTNAKILGVIVFVLVPSLALAQSGGQTLARIDKAGTEARERGPSLGGSGANGSDGGAVCWRIRCKRNYRALV